MGLEFVEPIIWKKPFTIRGMPLKIVANKRYSIESLPRDNAVSKLLRGFSEFHVFLFYIHGANGCLEEYEAYRGGLHLFFAVRNGEKYFLYHLSDGDSWGRYAVALLYDIIRAGAKVVFHGIFLTSYDESSEVFYPKEIFKAHGLKELQHVLERECLASPPIGLLIGSIGLKSLECKKFLPKLTYPPLYRKYSGKPEKYVRLWGIVELGRGKYVAKPTPWVAGVRRRKWYFEEEGYVRVTPWMKDWSVECKLRAFYTESTVGRYMWRVISPSPEKQEET